MDNAQSQMTPEFAQRLAAAQSSLYSFIVSLMGRLDEAGDVLQETNLKLCREFRRYDESKPFINWALTLARFEVMAWRTRQSRSRLVLDADVMERMAASLEVSSQYPDRELAALESCLQKLPPDQRKLVQERYEHGATVRDIAQRSGQRENAMAALFYRIRRVLHDCVTATLVKEERA